MQSTFTLLGRFLLFFLAFGVAFFSMRYWSFERISFLNLKPDEVFTDPFFRVSFYGHVIFGPLALMSGPFQFLPKFRTRNIKAHRFIGKIYIIACLIAGIAGLSAAQFTPGGSFTQLGFSLLAVSWLYTTSKAIFAVRKKEIALHQQWMIRSYALTLSAVTLRLYLLALQDGLGFTFIESYQIVGWLCWVPNMVVAEWWIRTRM
ncbi:MAG: DUF2306 domain-containing protein [Bacteroidota bacterium]